MSVQVEKLDKGMAKLTVEVDAARVDEAINKVYVARRGKISIPGFRKGKAPRMMIERMYGKDVFYDDASDTLIQESYPDAVDECGESVVSSPEVSVVQIEPGKPFIYEAVVALKPPVSLGKYKGIAVEKRDTSVSEEEVNEELERQRKLGARDVTVTDRAVQTDDTVKLDYEGFIDGKPFEGGKDEGHLLTIGSGAFIPGFEDGLIGKQTGEDCDITVTFPEEYHASDLAGREAVFKCHIHEIRAKELPELDDEFASDVSEYETLAEFKDGLRKQMEENKEKDARLKREDECVEALIEDSEMELPEAMVETQQRQMVNDMSMQLSMQGLNMQQYMQMTGQGKDALMEQARPQAIQRIKARLVLEEVAKKENIEATDEDFENKLEEMAKQYRMPLDKIKELTGDREAKQIREDIVVEKAAQFLVDNAKATKEPKPDDADASTGAAEGGAVPKKRAVPRKRKADKEDA